MRVPLPVIFLIIWFALVLIGVPWFFLPWIDISVIPGLPLWVLIAFIDFLVLAIGVAMATFLFWDRLARK